MKPKLRVMNGEFNSSIIIIEDILLCQHSVEQIDRKSARIQNTKQHHQPIGSHNIYKTLHPTATE